MIGRIVRVIVDRPLGSVHPKHKDICYSVNYGYVPGVLAADGEEQDAYVIGVTEPLREFTGELVAIYDAQAKKYATTLKPPANHIFYPDGERMPDTWTLELKPESPLDPSHEYILSVKGKRLWNVAIAQRLY